MLKFLEKFLANNFALSDAEDNTSGLCLGGQTLSTLIKRRLTLIDFLFDRQVIVNDKNICQSLT